MKLIPASVTRGVAKKVLQTKKNSPHIFFVGGIAGMIGSTVLACRATLKLEPVVDEIHTDLEAVKQMGRPSQSGGDLQRYPDREYYKDLTFVYAKSAGKIAKLYGPSAILGVASVGALTGSHVQLTRRNSALTATLALVTKAYDDYRERIREEIGEARELDIYRNVEEETEKIGGKNQVVRTIKDGAKFSPYAKCFDEQNINYRKDAELNRLFITCQQEHANLQLQTKGYLFLNDVYRALGFEETRAGQIVGWLWNSDVGDNYIDFGMFTEENARFVNGWERSVWLDFNVDGDIFSKINVEEY